MTNQRHHLVCMVSIFLATFIAGSTITLAVNIYNKDALLQEEKFAVSLATFNRAIVVRSIDRENGTILVSMSRSKGVYDIAHVLVPKETKIERQTPLFENGVIVGFSSPVPASFEELAPNVRGYINVSVNKDGLFVAQSILIGDPFPRP